MCPASRPAGTTTSSRTATCDAELDISATCVVNRDTTTTKKRATGKCIGASASRAGRTGQRKGRGPGPSARAGSRRAGGWRCVSGRRCVKRGWQRWVRRAGWPSRAAKATGGRQRNRAGNRRRACVGSLVWSVGDSARRRAGTAVPAMPATAGAAQRTVRNSRENAGRRRSDAASLTPPPRSPDATRAAHTHPAAPSVPHAVQPRSRCPARSRGSGRHCARSTAGAR